MNALEKAARAAATVYVSEGYPDEETATDIARAVLMAVRDDAREYDRLVGSREDREFADRIDAILADQTQEGPPR